MEPFRLTLKNYRCFTDCKPLSIDIGLGFTALVGPNNSGKSSILKFFHEFRPFFENLATPDGIASNTRNLRPKSVDDWAEVFSNLNERELAIEIKSRASSANKAIRMKGTAVQNRQDHFDLLFTAELESGYECVIQGRSSLSAFNVEGPSGAGPVAIDVAWMEEGFSALSNTCYIGPFRNALNEGSGTYFDIEIGTTFVSQWNYWKTGILKRQNHAMQRVTDDIRHIFGLKQLEINASADQKTLQVVVDGRPYRLRELGGGLAQFIIVLGNLAVKCPDFALIDEPELNLHPSLQADFLTTVGSYVNKGVIFATHSMGLARTVAERIYSVRKTSEGSEVRAFEQTPNFAEFLGEMSFSAFKEMGHECVLLVEGTTEVKAVQQFLRKLKKDHEIVVIPLGGSSMIHGGVEQELSELTRISKKVHVLIDSEKESAGSPLVKDRDAFVASCKKLGFGVHVTERRAFENYLSDSAIKAAKGKNYSALGPFDKLGDASPKWSKSENWRIAREMSHDELLATDVGRFLQTLS